MSLNENPYSFSTFQENFIYNKNANVRLKKLQEKIFQINTISKQSNLNL